MVRTTGAVVSVIALVVGSATVAAPKRTDPPPPIRFSRPAPPLQTVEEVNETYGDWSVVEISESVYMAAVRNNAGNGFGTMCFDGKCYSFFETGIDCDEGHRYPALINAPGGSYAVSLLCEKIGDYKLYSTPLDNSISEALAVGGVLGIAFPMASGEFKVARFSLTGAARASARASQLANGQTPDHRQNASDNQTL